MATTIISVCICAGSLLVALIALIISRTDRKENDKEDFIKVNLKLDTICQNLNEVRVEQRSLSSRVNQMDKELYKMQSDIKTAFLRIDELKEVKR